MKNKKGQTMPLAILGFLAVIICGFTFVNFLLPEVSNFRIDMGCSDATTIHDGNKILCLIGDSTIIYVIISILALGVGLIIERMRL
jgi:hypothetical protein